LKLGKYDASRVWNNNFKVTVYVKNGKFTIFIFSIKINISLESFNSEKEISKKSKYSPRKWDDRFSPGSESLFLIDS